MGNFAGSGSVTIAMSCGEPPTRSSGCGRRYARLPDAKVTLTATLCIWRGLRSLIPNKKRGRWFLARQQSLHVTHLCQRTSKPMRENQVKTGTKANP